MIAWPPVIYGAAGAANLNIFVPKNNSLLLQLYTAPAAAPSLTQVLLREAMDDGIPLTFKYPVQAFTTTNMRSGRIQNADEFAEQIIQLSCCTLQSLCFCCSLAVSVHKLLGFRRGWSLALGLRRGLPQPAYAAAPPPFGQFSGD
jgi:hypothetical protein